MQTPRVHAAPAYVSSRGREAIEVAAAAGLKLDPWQELVLIDGCGIGADGKWSAFEVGTDVARQNGKGGIYEARELAGVFAFGDRLLIHSAHEFATATEAFLRMEDLLAGTPEFSREVKSVSRSHGQEGFVFRSGQRLRYRTRTAGGGRGFSADFLALDEAMVLKEAFIAALLPTQSARSITGNPATWYAGSAVDQMIHEHGVVFARLRERGLRGDDPSLAWFEWSAEFVDGNGEVVTLEKLTLEHLADRKAWRTANPGLGIRIAESHVENELRSMGARSFAVERLGIGDWPATHTVDGEVISLEAWNALVDEESAMVDPICLAFDVRPDRSSSSIAAAGARADGIAHGELVQRGQGTEWLAPRLAELVGKHEVTAVLCDSYGPAGSIVHEVEELGVEVTIVSAKDHANACGSLFDAVERDAFRHLDQPELAQAVKAATKRPLGDAWAWSRKGGVDISPLVAVTLAAWGAETMSPIEEPWVGAW